MWKYIRKAALLCLCGCMFFNVGCGREEPMNTTEEDPVFSEAGYRRTVIYYRSDEGFIVPVMKLLPWEEGIGKAALSHLVGTEENIREAAAKGLQPLLPDGVKMELRISDDKLATLNLIGLNEYPDAASEQAMVTCVAETLMEFSSIDRVQFKFDGKVLKKMPNGTPVAEPIRHIGLNPDPGELSTSAGFDANRLTLYFPNTSGSLNVPVTRYVEGPASFETAMRELVQGPVQSGLMACLPDGTKLLSCSMEEGMVTVDFSDEIERAEDVMGMTEAMYDAIFLTASCFGTVSELHITANGAPFLASDMESPRCANEWNS